MQTADRTATYDVPCSSASLPVIVYDHFTGRLSGPRGSCMAKELPRESKGFNPFGDLIGLDFTGHAQGYSRCRLVVRNELLNPHSVLHGGVIYSMADTGMGGALYSLLAENELCATVEIKIVYFAAVRSGTLTCDTRVIQRRSHIATLESEITNDDRLVAKALGTFYIFKKE